MTQSILIRTLILSAILISVTNAFAQCYTSDSWLADPACTQQEVYTRNPYGYNYGFDYPEESTPWVASDDAPGMGGVPGDPGTGGGGGMGDLPGDPGYKVPIQNDMYAFVILGLCYSVFIYVRKEKKGEKLKCNPKETLS